MPLAATPVICLLNKTPRLYSVIKHDFLDSIRKVFHKSMQCVSIACVNIYNISFSAKKLLKELIAAINNFCPGIDVTVAQSVRS